MKFNKWQKQSDIRNENNGQGGLTRKDINSLWWKYFVS